VRAGPALPHRPQVRPGGELDLAVVGEDGPKKNRVYVYRARPEVSGGGAPPAAAGAGAAAAGPARPSPRRPQFGGSTFENKDAVESWLALLCGREPHPVREPPAAPPERPEAAAPPAKAPRVGLQASRAALAADPAGSGPAAHYTWTRHPGLGGLARPAAGLPPPLFRGTPGSLGGGDEDPADGEDTERGAALALQQLQRVGDTPPRAGGGRGHGGYPGRGPPPPPAAAAAAARPEVFGTPPRAPGAADGAAGESPAPPRGAPPAGPEQPAATRGVGGGSRRRDP